MFFTRIIAIPRSDGVSSPNSLYKLTSVLPIRVSNQLEAYIEQIRCDNRNKTFAQRIGMSITHFCPDLRVWT